MPLRIHIVAPGPEILGGQGVQAKALVEGLRNEGFDVTFLPINPRFPPGLRWVRKIPYARTILNQILYVPTLFTLRGADIVHIFCASYMSFVLAAVPAIIAARIFRKRSLLNYRSGEAEDHLTHWGLLVHPWLRMVDEIVVPSDYLRDVFRHFGYRVSVIRNVVDLSRFRYRERANVGPHLFSNRNFEPHYMVECTLRAFALLKRQYPEATLIVAGYGSQAQELCELASSLKVSGIQFIGRIEPHVMPSLYDKADIYLNASVIDNQPVSLLEAFSAGVPIVSTGTGDICFMIRHEHTGILVPQRDPEAMAKAIMFLLENPALALSIARQARQEVEKFTWPQVRKEWAALYSKGVQ